MNGPTQKTALMLAYYRAAESRLREVRDEAAGGMKASQDRGDVAAGNEWISKLEKVFEEFKAFREGLPREVLLSIHAERILESFSIDKENFVNLVIPADVSDEDAMHALDSRFRELFPDKGRAAIYEEHKDQILDAGNGSGRRARGPRVIKLIGVVPGTTFMNRDEQREALEQKGLTFPHPIEQALAAAAYACKLSGEGLFSKFWVRGSVPEFALRTGPDFGVYVPAFRGGSAGGDVAASGSPSFVKTTAGKPSFIEAPGERSE